MEIKITVNVSGNEPVEIKVDIPEKGECKTENKTTDASIYAVWFDENSIGWTKNSELNKMFLIQQQNLCNEKLRRNGYLFLNEVYDCLGIPRTAYGQLAGWVYNTHNPVGDNFVDFGLYEERNRGFINGFEKNVLLDFNVDGDILKYL